MEGMQATFTILSGLLTAAWLYRNWQEAEDLMAAQAGQVGQPVVGQVVGGGFSRLWWWLAASFDDVIPALFLVLVFRAFQGSILAFALACLIWGAMTVWYLRATRAWNFRGLVRKVLDDIADGWLLFSAIACWFLWMSISVPALSLSI